MTITSVDCLIVSYFSEVSLFSKLKGRCVGCVFPVSLLPACPTLPQELVSYSHMICRHREMHGVTWQGISSVGSEQINLNFLFCSIKFILWCPKELFDTFVCVCVCVYEIYIWKKIYMETLICLTFVVGSLLWNYIIFQNWLHRWQTFRYTMEGTTKRRKIGHPIKGHLL